MSIPKELIKPGEQVVPISQAETVPTDRSDFASAAGRAVEKHCILRGAMRLSAGESYGDSSGVRTAAGRDHQRAWWSSVAPHPRGPPCISVMRKDGTGAAETVVMLRTKLSLSRILMGLAACCALGIASPALAGPPQSPGAVEPDYEASGFVTPAGYSAPSSAEGQRVMQAGGAHAPAPQQAVRQVGLFSHSPMACDVGGCDAAGFCGHCGSGDWQCAGGCRVGGLMGRVVCPDGSGMSGLRHICLFCRGGGCGACQSIGRANVLGLLRCLAPYSEAGLGAQRWYDISAEALFLRIDRDAAGFPITGRGQGPGTAVVIGSNDAYNDDLEAGVRLSAAMVFGVGGNLELTYMGMGEFNGARGVGSFDPTAPADLFSYLSDFGTDPPGGFDDTDQSIFQGIETESRFHTFEFNYRRRWVGPYSRFQGSWLAGFRYVDLDDHIGYRAVGLNNDTVTANDLRFYENRVKASNSMSGFQLGGDLWWNVYPGINLGCGIKGALLGNTARIDSSIVSNSIGPGGVDFPLGLSEVGKSSDTAFLTELNLTAIYRLSYSCSLRSSFHAISIDDVVLGAPAFGSQAVAGIGTGNAAIGLAPLSHNNEVVLTGFSFGAEYLW
jgi:hypothetical protein